MVSPVVSEMSFFSSAEPDDLLSRASLALLELGGRPAQVQDWDVAFDFGSATSFRLWGAWFPPHPEKRLPFRLKVRTVRDGDRTHARLSFESTAGPYLVKAPGAEAVFLRRYEHVGATVARASGGQALASL